MNSITVRELQIGDILTSWCLWNTKNGLERIPKSRIGEKLKFRNKRDIFLELVSIPDFLTFEEWMQWNREH